jgi:hypothetical protein
MSTSPFTSVSVPPPMVRMVHTKTQDSNWRIVPLYKAGMDVNYRNDNGVQECKILTVHHNDPLELYYTIRLQDRKEKQTNNTNITLWLHDKKGVMKIVWLINILQDNNVHNMLLFYKNKE